MTTTTQPMHLSDLAARCWSYQDPTGDVAPTTVEDCLRRTPWNIFKQSIFKFLPDAATWFDEHCLDDFASSVATNRVDPTDGRLNWLDDLHRDGATDLIIAALWRERPDACDAMELPKPTVAGGDDMQPARWFDERTNGVLTPDRLSKAWRDGRIEGEKRSGRLYYDVASVIKVNTDFASRLVTTTNSD